MTKRTNNVRIIKDEQNPETPEILAASLIKIADAFEILMGYKDGLNQRAIIQLIVGLPGMNVVGKREVELVLEGLKRLKSYYIRK